MCRVVGDDADHIRDREDGGNVAHLLAALQVCNLHLLCNVAHRLCNVAHLLVALQVCKVAHLLCNVAHLLAALQVCNVAHLLCDVCVT